MGLRQTISQWIATIKDTLDLGPEFSAAVTDHRARFTEELTQLQHLLEQAQRAAQKKDELIAKLQAAGTVRGDMVVDGSAYYVKRENALDGPFCTSCFEQSHEVARLGPAPKPKGADGDPAEWVQCTKCQTPFRSERIGQYLNPRQTASVATAVSPQVKEKSKPVKAAKRLHSQARQPKNQPSEQTRTIARRRAPG